MATPQPADPVKRIVAMLWADAGARDEARRRLAELWGPIDHEGPDRLFDVTPYYGAEMGPTVHRRIIAFAGLAPPEELASWKLSANALEVELAAPDGRRRVNLDAGYIDHHKLVLASAKPAGQKIHLGGGIYADIILRYRAGRLEPLEWSFPDFRDGRHESELLAIRERYMEQIRGRR